MTTNPFVKHRIAYPVELPRGCPGESLPPVSGLYDYVLAADGVCLRANREGLSITLRIADCEVRGLVVVEPEFAFTLPRVPLELTQTLLDRARAEKGLDGRPVEVMYHLSFIDGEWEMEKPAQTQTRTAVHPIGPFAGTSYATYFIEVHSHHELDFHEFSGTDDASEGTKFRFFGLLTDIFKNPALKLRLNVYGYKVDVPASVVFELPEELVSADDTEQWLEFYETFRVTEADDA